jgi:hypothetical protein
MSKRKNGGAEEDRAPRPAERQEAPQPERPVPEHERTVGDGQDDKPSQAEGERDTADGGGGRGG